MTVAADQFAGDPIAPASAQFALNSTTFTGQGDNVPSPIGVRPWGLRRALPASAGYELPAWTYDEAQQKAVDVDGRPLIEVPMSGPPTAKTTSSTDGEDPPSSEDWIND